MAHTTDIAPPASHHLLNCPIGHGWEQKAGSAQDMVPTTSATCLHLGPTFPRPRCAGRTFCHPYPAHPPPAWVAHCTAPRACQAACGTFFYLPGGGEKRDLHPITPYSSRYATCFSTFLPGRHLQLEDSFTRFSFAAAPRWFPRPQSRPLGAAAVFPSLQSWRSHCYPQMGSACAHLQATTTPMSSNYLLGSSLQQPWTGAFMLVGHLTRHSFLCTLPHATTTPTPPPHTPYTHHPHHTTPPLPTPPPHSPHHTHTTAPHAPHIPAPTHTATPPPPPHTPLIASPWTILHLTPCYALPAGKA